VRSIFSIPQLFNSNRWTRNIYILELDFIPSLNTSRFSSYEHKPQIQDTKDMMTVYKVKK